MRREFPDSALCLLNNGLLEEEGGGARDEGIFVPSAGDPAGEVGWVFLYSLNNVLRVTATH